MEALQTSVGISVDCWYGCDLLVEQSTGTTTRDCSDGIVNIETVPELLCAQQQLASICKAEH